MAKQVNATGGMGTITVSGIGSNGEAIQIVISQGETQVASYSGKLDLSGAGMHTFTLPAGTYDVEVTAPSPNGTVYSFPNTTVTGGL